VSHPPKKFFAAANGAGRTARFVNWLQRIKTLTSGDKLLPSHLRRGRIGEQAARKHLRRFGLKFLTANFRSPRGEVDLVFRDRDCLVFVEVKTRSSEDWTRPAAAVNARKRRLLSLTALDYLRLLKNPEVKIRFDVVEVLLAEEKVREIRHLPNTFALSPPYRYG
jgi:putative endonuclease